MYDDRLYELHAKICHTLAHPSRLKLIDCLRNGEARVIDLVKQLRLSQATISRHLAVMRSLGVVQARRDGQSVYYTLGSANITLAYDTMHQFAMEYLEQNSKMLHAIQG